MCTYTKPKIILKYSEYITITFDNFFYHSINHIQIVKNYASSSITRWKNAWSRHVL